MRRPATSLIVTCEHGGNSVPRRFAPLFGAHAALLATHRGYDPGAVVLARRIASAFEAPLFASRITRLLVDLNRSPGARSVFSEVTRGLDAATKSWILARIHEPHRDAIRREAARLLRDGGRLLHVASHSFTPVLDGTVRRTDIGLLHDPARRAEAALCRRLRRELSSRLPGLRVHLNLPYRGTTDGLTTTLRRVLRNPRYLGIEIEINQRHLQDDARAWRKLTRGIVGALGVVLRDGA